jgi:hypothetical protein
MTAAEKAMEAWGVPVVLPELIPVFLSREQRDGIDHLRRRLTDVGAEDAAWLLNDVIRQWETNYLMRDSLGIR